jgi:glycerol kinase
MMVTGDQPVTSTHGLLTTIAYQIGDQTTYALEGSVAHSGSTIQWLRDQLQLITQASETESLAPPHNDGLYFVPAFAGLFAPYWRPDARACIVGMTSSHDRGHVCRASLEAIAYQTKDVFDAIEKDSGVVLQSLRVDGGGTANQLLMQFQADIINVPVTCPVVLETTALGVAFAAGLAVGVWKDLDEIKALWAVAKTFEPNMSEAVRQENLKGWKKAITKSLDWVEVSDAKRGLSRAESAIIDGDFEDAYSDEKDLERAIDVADRKTARYSMAFSIFSQLFLTTAAVALGYVLGERRPGLLNRERLKLPKLQLPRFYGYR